MKDNLKKPLNYPDIESLEFKIEMEKKKVRTPPEELSHIIRAFHENGIKKAG